MGYFSKFNQGQGIPFMDGADKIDIPQGEKLTIVDYGFIHGEDGDFAVLLFDEYPKCFAFGNSIITEDLKMMEVDFSSKSDVLAELANVKVVFSKRKNKTGKREYMAVEFVED